MDVRQIYKDSTVRGATPLELVVLLYDSAIEDMGRALTAMQASDIESRAARVQHALMVLQQLQGTLDFERGGGSAKQLEQFYNVVRAKLLEAQIRSSPELMRQQIRCMSEVRDCWVQAKRIVQPGPRPASDPAPTPQPAPAATLSDISLDDEGMKSEWDA